MKPSSTFSKLIHSFLRQSYNFILLFLFIAVTITSCGSGGGEDSSPSENFMGNSQKWKTVDAGFWHTVAIKEDGTLYAWGLNDAGQLGLGDTTTRLTPTKVGEDSD